MKTPKKWYLSRFAYFFEGKDGESIILYHSLKIRMVFLTKTIVQNIRLFHSGLTIADFLKKIPDNEKQEYRELIKQLKRIDFLICDRNEDLEALDFIVKNAPKPYPHILYLMVADDCNLACTYCFEGMNCLAKKNLPDKRETMMGTEVAEKAIKRYSELIRENPRLFNREKKIIFYGGEPLLNFQTIKFSLEMIKRYQADGLLPKNTKLMIISNGTLLTEEMAKIIKRYKVDISISLDGPKEQSAARIFPNGKEAFSSILRGLDICKRLGLKTSISCTITDKNIDDCQKIIDFIIDNNIKAVGFNMMLGKTSYNYADKAADFIIKAHQRFKENDIWEDRMSRKVEAFFKAKLLLFDCAAAGGHQLVVSPEGSFGICHGFFSDRKYFSGNVNDTSYNPLDTDIFKEWNKRTPLNMEGCRDCPGLGICGGGCLMNAEKEYGSIWKKDERFCVHCLKTLEYLLWDTYYSNTY